MNGRPRRRNKNLHNIKDVHTSINKIITLEQCLRFGRTPFTQIPMSIDLNLQENTYKGTQVVVYLNICSDFM